MFKTSFIFVLVLILLAACSEEDARPTPAAELPTPEPTPRATPTLMPTPRPTETVVPTPTIPNIAVANQVLTDEGELEIISVITTQPGWVVVYSWRDGGLQEVLGYTAVNPGMNNGVKIAIDPLEATPTLVAMLHVDEGEPDEFEFPQGTDGPLAYEGGFIAASFTPEFQLSIPIISVKAQAVSEDGLVTIENVIALEPGWLVIQADAAGQPGPYLGAAPLVTGFNENIQVHIPWLEGTKTLYASIYEDNGRPDRLDLTGEDTPFLVSGEPVIASIAVTYPPDLFVMDQPVVNGIFEVERAYSDGPGWLVVYFDNEGEPGLIIGSVALQDGVNEQLQVEVVDTAVTNPLYLLIHEDSEAGDEFDFPRVDPPISYDDRQVRPLVFNTEPGNYLIGQEQFIPAGETGEVEIVVPFAVVEVPSWVVIEQDAEEGRGDVIGFTAIDQGLNRDIVVSVSAAALTDVVYATLYADNGEIGIFEFPDGEDVPLQRNRLLEVPMPVIRVE